MIIDKYKYEIDNENAIRLWHLHEPLENDAPVIYQPCHPDGTPWENKDVAEQWIVNYINEKIEWENTQQEEQEE